MAEYSKEDNIKFGGMMTFKECEDFVVKFLIANRQSRYLKQDYNQVVGEIMFRIFEALPKYKKDRAVLDTFLFHVCKNALIKYKRGETSFYNQHFITDEMEDFKYEDKTPEFLAKQEELSNLIKKSELPKRTKEIVLLYITDPDRSMEEMAQHLGITRQGVSLHILSARQYLKKRNISI